jgi:VIT1/CCC1 family predicted Fe2+/Mn2+ transporter
VPGKCIGLQASTKNTQTRGKQISSAGSGVKCKLAPLSPTKGQFMPRAHKEFHRANRVGWLRAAVLGANDGTISVAALVVGVAASGAEPRTILITGVAGMIAGAMSMAAGEYVSVQSQADTEGADIAREREELRTDPQREAEELTLIYMKRGLDRSLAEKVSTQLMVKNALEAHARDELGITSTLQARPVLAALASAGAFTAGAIVPIVTVLLVPAPWVSRFATGTALLALLVFGGAAAYAGGASIVRGALRVAFWGALAMGLSAAVGSMFGVATG